jgi:hypothetical protein
MAEIYDIHAFPADARPRTEPTRTRNQELLAEIEAVWAVRTPEQLLMAELRGTEEELMAVHRKYQRLLEALAQGQPASPDTAVQSRSTRENPGNDNHRVGNTGHMANDGIFSRSAAMAEATETEAQADAIVAFEEGIQNLRREGVYDHGLGRRIPWADTSETRKLTAIAVESMTVSIHDEQSVPGATALAAIEREIDYAGLPAVQRDMLYDLRVQLDAGELDGPQPEHKDIAGMALARIVGVGEFERLLEPYKQDEKALWAHVPEDEKVRVLVDLAQEAGPPGMYTLAAIEREVNVAHLPVWRHEALEGLRARADRGELEGENPDPAYQGDRAEAAIRLAELDARIDDYKYFGVMDDRGGHHTWEALAEEEKFDRIMADLRHLHLDSEAGAYQVIGREVDMTRPLEGGRTNPAEEEAERQRQAKYALPNEAAAAFKSRIEEGLWTTCFTDGEKAWADWSDLIPEAKLYRLARVMDWEQVPESYFRTMAEREMRLEELPANLRMALDSPKENRYVFSQGFEEGSDAPAAEQGADRPGHPDMSGGPGRAADQRAAMVRELFDTANRVQVAELIQARALDPEIALRSASRVREVYFQIAEATWDSFREESDFRTEAEIRETLELFKAKEADLGDQAPKTLMDHLQAGGLFLNVDAARTGPEDHPPAVRDTTRNLVDAIWLDVWPRPGAIVDFGLKSQEHYEAIYYAVRNGEISSEALDAALGSGEKLTALARSSPSNPHKDIEFATDWDGMLPEPEDGWDSPPDSGSSSGGNQREPGSAAAVNVAGNSQAKPGGAAKSTTAKPKSYDDALAEAAERGKYRTQDKGKEGPER